MDIQYRHQTYTVDPCTLIVRGDNFYARIEVAGARVPMTVYVKIDPRLTGMVYCYPQPCTALTLWRPTLTVTPDQLWKPKSRGGIKLVECTHVNVVIQLEAA